MSVCFELLYFTDFFFFFFFKTHLTDPRENERFIFENTGEHVPLDQLSPRAREMCRGSEILRVRKTDEEGKAGNASLCYHCSSSILDLAKQLKFVHCLMPNSHTYVWILRMLLVALSVSIGFFLNN